MLAAPLQPAAVLESRDLAQYRPVKDIETFNTLLPPPIEFVEGSSSGTFAVAEGKYQPINGSGSGTPKAPAKPEVCTTSHAFVISSINAMLVDIAPVA